jgi:threonine dehydrogenase-like Zn-dependent dehydrogenase
MAEDNPSIWFEEPGRVAIRSIPKPCPGEGEVLIRTQRTLISSGTEITMLYPPQAEDSAWSEFARFPRQAGYSHAGVVEDVGGGVEREWVGKRVASRCRHAGWVTTKVSDLRVIPDGVSAEEATFATLAGVAMNGLRRVGMIFGESVAVFGLGILGHLTARIAAAAGAGPVYGVETSALRLSKLPRRPPMHPHGGDLPSLLGILRGRGGGPGVDIAVETTGSASLIPEEARLVRDQGRLLLLSSPRAPTVFDFHDLCNRRSLSIVGAHGFSQPATASTNYPWTSKHHGDLFLEWLADGRISVTELITHHFSCRDTAHAYSLLRERSEEALGVIFDWQ